MAEISVEASAGATTSLANGPLPGDAPQSAQPTQAEMLCAAFGMNPYPENELERPDMDYLQEMAKLPVNFAEVPSGTDVQGMRRWIDNVFLQGPLAECRERCDVRRRRPTVPVDVHTVAVPCPGDGAEQFSICVYDPQSEATEDATQSRPAIIMLHGGGWIHGNPHGDEAISKIFASELRAVVFSVDYRLAPEHPFPAPLDDCCEALEWVIRESSTYKVDPTRIALWGASAGGNLAAAVALRYSGEAISTQHPSLRLISLVVPVTAQPHAQKIFSEQRTMEKSPNEELFAAAPDAPDLMVKEFEQLYDLYTGGATDASDPLISPLMAKPGAQHPATLVTVAACDHLKIQGLAYAQLLRSSGVKVTEEILPGVPHGFTVAVNAKATRNWVERQVEHFAAAFDDRFA